MKIGFIGLGIMGEPMCHNIIRKHDDSVFIFDINKERMDKVMAYGGIPCQSSLDVVEKSDLIITMVPRSEHAVKVYAEVKDAINARKIFVDMSTIDPEVSGKIHDMIAERGGHFLDAPVVKSKDAAIMGNVGIYVGGDRTVYDEIKPILQYMGRSIIYMGEHGHGIVMKICHNMLVAQIQNGVHEILALAMNEGIDIDRFSAALSYGGGQNAYLDTKLMALKNKDYTTQFSVANMAKDLEIGENMAMQQGMQLKGTKAPREIYKKAMKDGIGDLDFSSVFELVYDEYCIKKNNE